MFRGIHKANLRLYVATYEALLNTKQLSAAHSSSVCVLELYQHTLATHEPRIALL
jgi:hypothetical protein